MSTVPNFVTATSSGPALSGPARTRMILMGIAAAVLVAIALTVAAAFASSLTASAALPAASSSRGASGPVDGPRLEGYQLPTLFLDDSGN